MSGRVLFLMLIGSLLIFSSCSNDTENIERQPGMTKAGDMRNISIDELRDKIAGGWAGKMIGVSYGAKSEFRALGKTYEEPLPWEPSMLENSIMQDDIYVQMSFMMTMDKYGINASAKQFGESFASAGYRLWHANVMARKNYFDGIYPPDSGSPEYNLHADDIDFQIEADYIGFMCPGMPVTANKLADKVGRVMNYGDGLYGGMFVAALYAEAFFNDDIPAIVERALLSIPAESDYYKCIRDVVILHAHYPDDWRAAWAELENKWGDVDICGALVPFNIDAKLNGAYIIMGLLYGDGDFEKTMEVSTRCGQDSDCNPSNAAAVIGVINGLSGIPDEWKSGLDAIADSTFIFTNYTFNTAVDRTMHYAREFITRNDGQWPDKQKEGEANGIAIKYQEPLAPPLEVAFPDMVPDYRSNAFEDDGWSFTGDWKIETRNDKPFSKYSANAGDEVSFTFNGSGVVIRGDWRKNSGKADAYIDGKFHRSFDTHFFWADQEKFDAFLWHITGLNSGKHTVKIVVKGQKKDNSEGANIYIKGATVFKTGKKKNETVKFSFEK